MLPKFLFVGKNKLYKYAQSFQYDNILQPSQEEVFKGYALKGIWKKEVFENEQELIVELGAGKGETSLMLAQKYPDKNFIAIDIKGDRLLKGAKEAVEMGLKNLVFLRIQIEHILYAFAENEIDEIWITFPDPHPKERRSKKRMTSDRFLNLYTKAVKDDGILHLKTDSTLMHEFTIETLEELRQEIIYCTSDLYAEENANPDATLLQTYYERKWLAEGKKIKYLQFKLSL